MRSRPDDLRRWLATLGASAWLAASPAAAADDGVTAPASATDNQPITLVVGLEGGLIDARVVAAAPCDCGGRFRIESQSGSANRSVNTSSFGALDEIGKVLSHIRFGRSADWSIRLTVSIDGREEYVIVRSSDLER